jgi:hypothetical protein
MSLPVYYRTSNSTRVHILRLRLYFHSMHCESHRQPALCVYKPRYRLFSFTIPYSSPICPSSKSSFRRWKGRKPIKGAKQRTRLLRHHPVINHLEIIELISLRNYDVADVSSLATDILETPGLRGKPTSIGVNMAQHEIGWLVKPVLGEEIRIDPAGGAALAVGGDEGGELGFGHELGAAANLAEDVVLVLALGPGENADLARRRQPTGRLVDLDARRALVRLRLRNSDGDGRQSDGLARQPAHALQHESRFSGVRKRLVLDGC